MKIFYIALSFFIVSNLSFSELKYEDVDKNHWAYNSINELVQEGIIKEDTFKFEGNKPITRYEFAVELASAMNKINLEKASKSELKVLESLVRDFSKELNEIGFDASKFNGRIKDSEENIENLKKEIKVINIKMERMEKKIQKIENELRI